MNEKLKKFYKDHEEYVIQGLCMTSVAAMWCAVGIKIGARNNEVVRHGTTWVDPETKTMLAFRVTQRNGQRSFFWVPVADIN